MMKPAKIRLSLTEVHDAVAQAAAHKLELGMPSPGKIYHALIEFDASGQTVNIQEDGTFPVDLNGAMVTVTEVDEAVEPHSASHETLRHPTTDADAEDNNENRNAS